MNQSLNGRTVLVTGANGGLGQHFVDQALQRGAAKVYAAARTDRQWTDDRVVPVRLDITVPDDVTRVAAVAQDVDLLVNNAGIAPHGDTILAPDESLRQIFETNFFGTMHVTQAFTPVLAANGGGTLVNILSVSAWIPIPTGYAASKAALWSATNSVRLMLRGQGTTVIGVVLALADTPMAAHLADVPKSPPAEIVAQVYDAVADGRIEVLGDAESRAFKARLATPAEEYYPVVEAQVSMLLSSS